MSQTVYDKLNVAQAELLNSLQDNVDLVEKTIDMIPKDLPPEDYQKLMHEITVGEVGKNISKAHNMVRDLANKMK